MTIEIHYKNKTKVEIFTPTDQVSSDWLIEFMASTNAMLKAGVIQAGLRLQH